MDMMSNSWIYYKAKNNTRCFWLFSYRSWVIGRVHPARMFIDTRHNNSHSIIIVTVVKVNRHAHRWFYKYPYRYYVCLNIPLQSFLRDNCGLRQIDVTRMAKQINVYGSLLLTQRNDNDVDANKINDGFWCGENNQCYILVCRLTWFRPQWPTMPMAWCSTYLFRWFVGIAAVAQNTQLKYLIQCPQLRRVQP